MTSRFDVCSMLVRCLVDRVNGLLRFSVECQQTEQASIGQITSAPSSGLNLASQDFPVSSVIPRRLDIYSSNTAGVNVEPSPKK